MSIPVHFFSLFIRLDTVETLYPGRLAQFRVDFPRGIIEGGLIRFVSMSGQDIQDDFAQLASRGFDVDRHATIADMMGGAMKSGAGIVFENTGEDPVVPCWVARLA